ncbi:alkanesulfonate monooxygenase SsuD/methylene tetrahydromethanopterin reductase-like flavin-dependent oxidoreductase (luciferase family) [Catenuloplanes nepalensis]|uniref:Alkanesulfonate monooxygenase SsuD/methylene tetrahydromethanopterin reductase-like flavin-dependent oxidoreductase (Luciferase family) n=1 Tax=Catenuloplanes nepalensis TaxID=587533 RepID=A0ABT9MK82_9ACTN|nr:LLM class flavin-dependent oxidoreductase [Catenuloplanes nepalensis]MDP9791819.1 alkanesulfonate monooxygenase SsuD/methylene tetrahydromethanopterin reductase-like flavin-dependent oxidoreductase (luciferase family) [Catenuloplanes nepalensis]
MVQPDAESPVRRRLGLFLLGAHGPASIPRLARAAEDAGLDDVWLAEHHFTGYGTLPSATVAAGHALGATRRIEIGTAACVLPNRHPVALGEEAALLHELSGGRFRLGVARGGPWVDLEVFGTGPARRDHGFPESLDLLCAWLSGAYRVGSDRDLFKFREVTVSPRVAMPVWVAATSPATAAEAARRGLPLLLGMHADVSEKTDMLAHWASVAEAAGQDPAGADHLSVHLAPGPAPLLESLLERTRDYVRIDGSPPVHRDLGEYAARLRRIHETIEDIPGVRRTLLFVEAAGPPEAVQQAISAARATLRPMAKSAPRPVGGSAPAFAPRP